MVELNCETDFAARTDEFKELAHNLAMQVAAMQPQFISKEEVPDGADAEPQTACLLLQPYIKDQERSVQDIITELEQKILQIMWLPQPILHLILLHQVSLPLEI